MKNEAGKIDNQQGNGVLPCVSGSALIAEFDGWEKIRIDTGTTTNFKPVYVDGIKKGSKP
jgi:hypothetical protein